MFWINFRPIWVRLARAVHWEVLGIVKEGLVIVYETCFWCWAWRGFKGRILKSKVRILG